MNRREALKSAAAVALGALCSPWSACRNSSGIPKIEGLSSSAQKLIAGMAETILPQTDTPGAKAAEVDIFVMRALKDCYSSEERIRFVQGLNAFERSCHSRFGRTFLECSVEQQIEAVERLDQEVFGFWGKVKARILGQAHFYRTLKQLSLTGYFTSMQGATKALVYDPVPGKWIGCKELKQGQRGWAT